MRKCCVAALGVALLIGTVGCRAMAEDLGFSNPDVTVKKTAFGFEARLGTDFRGKGDVRYNPKTGEFTLIGEMASDPTSVIRAESDRAAANLEAFKVIASYRIESQKIVGENFRAFGQMLALAAAAGGDAVAQVVKAGAPGLEASNRGIGQFMESMAPALIGAATGLPVPAAAPPP